MEGGGGGNVDCIPDKIKVVEWGGNVDCIPYNSKVVEGEVM